MNVTPYRLISPSKMAKQPWICTGCWGEKSFDIASLRDVGMLCYVEQIWFDEDPRSALVLINGSSQGHHDAILAAFARKPLPEPPEPDKGADPEAKSRYDEWSVYFEPKRRTWNSDTKEWEGETTNWPYLSPATDFDEVGSLWDWVYMGDSWERFIGHASTSYEIIQALMKHHGLPHGRRYDLERWLFGYCGGILADYEKQFGPLADYGGDKDDQQVGTN